MNMFHDLLKHYNMTLVTSAVVSDNTDIKVLISRLLVSDSMKRHNKIPHLTPKTKRKEAYSQIDKCSRKTTPISSCLYQDILFINRPTLNMGFINRGRLNIR